MVSPVTKENFAMWNFSIVNFCVTNLKPLYDHSRARKYVREEEKKKRMKADQNTIEANLIANSKMYTMDSVRKMILNAHVLLMSFVIVFFFFVCSRISK